MTSVLVASLPDMTLQRLSSPVVLKKRNLYQNILWADSLFQNRGRQTTAPPPSPKPHLPTLGTSQLCQFLSKERRKRERREKSYWNTATPIHTHVVYGCSGTTKQQHWVIVMDCEAGHIYFLALYRKFVNLWSRGHILLLKEKNF